MIGPDGRTWWTTEKATEQLGVDRKRLNDWVRRSKEAGHVAAAWPLDCPACRDQPSEFPHVDPPHRAGRFAAYISDQLLAAEAYTWSSSRGGVSRDVT